MMASRTKLIENRIIYANEGINDSKAIEEFLKFEKFADSMNFALSLSLEGFKNSYFRLLDEMKSKEAKKYNLK